MNILMVLQHRKHACVVGGPCCSVGSAFITGKTSV